MLLAMLVAAAVSFAATPLVKTLACKVGAIDVPKDNRRMHKVPIPRMGGLAIFLAFLLSVLVFAEIDRQMQGILLGAIMIVILGVLDDIMALKALPKLFVQIAAAGVAVWHGCRIQFISNPNVFSEATYLNLGWLSIPVTIIWIVAITNAVNFIDGLDGLATGVSVPIVAVLGVLAYLSGHIVYADYLNIMYIPDSGELVVFAAAFAGALVGFLWYNSFPAQIFMGDTGSLSIGGIIAVFALCIRKELLLPLLCGVFLVESFSVMMQVGYFKYTKRKFGEGQRLLLMAPVHHHFQKKGQFETKIVLRFWIISLLLAAITLVTLKIR